MAFNKKELDQNFKLFSINGFNFKKEIMGYSWTKQYPDRKVRIIIGYRGYPDSYVVYTPTVNIYFDTVENILEEYGLGEEYKSTFGKSFQGLKDVDFESLTTEINSQESFDNVKKEIETIIEKGILPFANQFSSLKAVANFLANKTPIEIVPFIQGSILYPKTILIMKLANHPDFKKRLIEFRNILFENVDNNYRYPILLNKFDSIFSEDLKTMV